MSGSLGWHVISGEDLLRVLRRVEDGESPDIVYAEEYVNARRESVPPVPSEVAQPRPSDPPASYGVMGATRWVSDSPGAAAEEEPATAGTDRHETWGNARYFTIVDDDTGLLVAVGPESDFRDVFLSLKQPRLPARWFIRWLTARGSDGESVFDEPPEFAS